jgi:hypothetical protein
MKYLTTFFQVGNVYFAFMNDAFSRLVRSIFQKESLHDCSLEELQTMAREYPYFTPVQLLLAEKLKSIDDSQYKAQIGKLSLYFTNPLWLDYQINGYKTGTDLEPQPETANSIKEVTTEEERPETEATYAQVVVDADQSVPTDEQAGESISETEIENVPSFDESERLVVENAEHPKVENFDAQTQVNSEQNLETRAEAESIVQPEHEHLPPLDETQTDAEATQENFNTENSGAPVQNEAEVQIESIDENRNEPVSENLSPIIGSPSVETQEDKNAFIQESPGSAEVEADSIADKELEDSRVSIPPLPELSQEPVETELTFEPYHTVDYFASQGIRFIPEEKPADRFGQQLKSFTEWLKTLKRLPETEVRIPDEASEEKVRQLADHSINKDEVVTESMAEVWLKQGNKEKAIETYNKLSLLNPGKSAYFASLVEQLKDS